MWAYTIEHVFVLFSFHFIHTSLYIICEIECAQFTFMRLLFHFFLFLFGAQFTSYIRSAVSQRIEALEKRKSISSLLELQISRSIDQNKRRKKENKILTQRKFFCFVLRADKRNCRPQIFCFSFSIGEKKSRKFIQNNKRKKTKISFLTISKNLCWNQVQCKENQFNFVQGAELVAKSNENHQFKELKKKNQPKCRQHRISVKTSPTQHQMTVPMI